MLFEGRLQAAKRNTAAFLALSFVVMPVHQSMGFNISSAFIGPFKFSMDVQPMGAQTWYSLVRLNESILKWKLSKCRTGPNRNASLSGNRALLLVMGPNSVNNSCRVESRWGRCREPNADCLTKKVMVRIRYFGAPHLKKNLGLSLLRNSLYRQILT